MSDVTAAATLSLAIDTGDAAAKLDKLKLAYGQLKGELANGLPSTGISKEAESQIANLKKLANDQRAAMAVLSGQVDDLTNRLTKGLGSAGKAAEELGKSLKTSIQAGAGSLSGAFKLDETQVNALKDRMKRLGVESASALSSGLTNANFKAATDAASAFEQNTVRSLTKVIATAKLYEATLAEFGEETALSKFGSGYASGAFKEQAETNLKLLREQELAAKRAAEVEKYLAAEQKKALTEEARLSQLRIDTHVRSVKAREATERAYTAWWAAELDKRERLEKAAPVKSVTNSAERIFGNFLTASPKGQQAIIDKVQMAALLDAEAATARFGAGIAGLVPRMGELKAAQTAVIPSIKTATVEQHNWNKAAKDGHAFARGLSGSLGALWMTYGSMAPLMAGAALAGGFKAAVTAGSEFAYQLTFVKALGGETAQAVAQIGASALELSKTSMYGPGELANGLRMLSQAGLSARDSLLALPVAMNLATVGEMNMEQATLTLVGVMNAFGMGITDLTHIGDMFSKAAALSQTSVSAMTEAMKTASVVHDQYGASIEDTATAITLLAKVNITGTAAGTSYRNMLKDLYTPSKEAARVMEDLGIKTKDASGKLRDAPAIIADLKTKLQGFTQASQTDILGMIFSERGGKEAIQMLGAVGEEWDTLKAKISNSEGFMAGVTAELEMTTNGRFKQALNTMQANMIKAFDASEGPVRNLADALRNLADSPEFIAGIKAIVEVMASLANALVKVTPLLIDFGLAWGAFKTLGTVVTGVSAVTSALGGLGTSAAIVSAEMAIAGKGTAGLIAGLTATGSAAGAAAGATGLGGLGAAIAFLTNPVTLAVAGLGALAYAAYKLKEDTPAGIVQVNNFNDALDRQIDKLRRANAELEEKNRLQNTGSAIDRDAAQANLDTLRKERKALEERVAARTAKARSSGNLQDLDRAENANTLDEQRIRQNKDAEIAQIQKMGELEKQQVRNDELNLKSYLAQARQGLKDLKDDAFHAKKKVKTTLIEAAIGQMEAGGLDQAGLRQVQRRLDRYMQEGRMSLLGSGTKTYTPPESGASARAAESAAAAARRRANKGAERDEKATIASYTERQNAEIASLASRAQNKLISEERNQMELVAIYAKYDDVIAQQYEAGINRLKTLQANAKADEKDALKAALTEMETAQAKFEADKLLRLQQSKDREQGIIKASNEATNKFIAEQEAAVQKQLEDLQEARIKSKMSAREEVQYDAGRNAELVFRKEEAAQLERIRGLRQDLIDQNMAAGQDFISAVANAENNGQLAAYVAKLDELVKKRGELVNKATAVAGENYDFTREFSTGWNKAFKDYEKAATDSAANAREMFQSASRAMEDAITQFVTTGKVGWRDLASTVLSEAARVMASKAVSSFLGMVVNFGMGSTSSVGPSAAAGGGTWLGNTSSIRLPTMSANGNVFSDTSLSRYSNTVQTTPQYFSFNKMHKFANGGVFAEAGPEAVMPLARDSNGRLGVRAQGGSGTDVAIYLTVNEAEGTTSAKSSGDANGAWSQFAARIRQMILEEMTNQKRPGGLLYA